MAYLADTNVLLRWVRLDDPQNALARAAVRTLHTQGETISVTPQNFIEFWGVATRPTNVNGFGMTPIEAELSLGDLERLFPLLPDVAAIYSEWRSLVVAAGVSGAQVHDARLVAVMQAHGISHLLTFNPSDFRRFPRITVVHPRDVVPAA
jgi:predicted nucleic acid-binding protein